MFKNATPVKALAFLRLNITAALFLPLSSEASKLEVTCHNILRILAILNSASCFYPLLNAVLTYTDPLAASQAAIYLIGVIAAISYTSVGIIRNNDIRMMMELTEASCKNVNDCAGRVYRHYMEQYSTFYGMSVIWCQITGVVFVLKPVVTSDSFPLNAIYPFRVDYQPLKSIIYFHQSYFIFNASASAVAIILCAFLLFFAGARFEVLKLKLRDIRSIDEMIILMKEYYVVKRYAEEVVSIVKFMSPCIIITCTIILVFSGINLIEPQPLSAKFQFIFVVGSTTLVVFVIAWPAHHLLDQSEDAMKDVFESTWYDQSKEMWRDVQIMMVPQAPVTISVPCIMPILSLNYFCSYLSNVFSLFSVLRVKMSDDE